MVALRALNIHVPTQPIGRGLGTLRPLSLLLLPLLRHDLLRGLSRHIRHLSLHSLIGAVDLDLRDFPV